MQPLKSLIFVRIGSANSHKYTVNKKQLRAFKTVCNNINKSLKEFEPACEYNIVDWSNNVYDKHWSYKKEVEYYKGKIASKELIDYRDLQEAFIGCWIRRNKDLYNKFNKLKSYCKFKTNSYHSPPQTRGLYAFPQYRLEPFLTHWDETKFDIKAKKDGTSCRMRAKNYVTINYNKPTLWCHFIDEAKELKVDIKVNKYWVLINSCDYLKVLALWEKRWLRQKRKDMKGNKHRLIYNPYQYSSKDNLEVFLVGV